MRLLPILSAALLVAACGSKGKVREPAELQPIAAPQLQAQVLWTQDAGSGTGRFHGGLRLSPHPDALFGADAKGAVFALQTETGKPLWKTRTGRRVIAGPAVAFDLVLVGTRDAEVLALDRATGALRWQAEVSSEVLAPPVSDGRVVVARTVDGKLFGIDAETGARLWAFDRNVPPLTLRGLSAPVLLQDVVVAGLDNGRIVAVRVADGQPVWEEVIAVPSGRSELERITDIDAELLVGDGILFVASYGGELAAISLERGNVLWRRSIRTYTGMALVDDLLVVTDADGIVWALDAASGAAAWKQEGLRNRHPSRPVIHEGHVAVTDFEGYVHWLAPADGSLVARERVAFAFGDGRKKGGGQGASPGFAAPPAVQEDRLYLTTAKGRVVAMTVRPAI